MKVDSSCGPTIWLSTGEISITICVAYFLFQSYTQGFLRDQKYIRCLASIDLPTNYIAHIAELFIIHSIKFFNHKINLVRTLMNKLDSGQE